MSAPPDPPSAAAGIIHLLTDEVIDQIAAGEVIERPASVVKELIENAIDAGASLIETHLEEGGLTRLVVSDDGGGMSALDAARAPLRHATSKLRRADDLHTITTLGFRGEALSSIAAVSRCVLSTRRAEDAVGTRVRLFGGTLARVEEVGTPVGTTVDVSDLFFNTPARQKFMRSPATEQAHACEAALRAVLGTQRVSLVVTAGERRLIDLPATNDITARARVALGAKAGRLYAFDQGDAGVRVRGVIARPDVDRGDAKGLWFFVNGRYVRDRMLQRAVLEGYRSMLGHGRYPLIMVYIDVLPAVVDVNVHPQKLEVRFSDASLIYRAVSRAIATILARTPWLAEGMAGTTVAAPDRPYEDWHSARQAETRSPLLGQRGFLRDGHEATPPSLFALRPLLPDHARRAGTMGLPQEAASNVGPTAKGHPECTDHLGYFGGLRPLGQALGVYLVCAGHDEIVLVDQHAAHERVTYERLCAHRRGGNIARQQLLFPEAIELSSHQAAVLDERWPALGEYGFEIEPIGPARFAIRAVPALCAAADARRLAHDLIDEVCALEEAGLGLASREAESRLLSRCACHAAVRANDDMAPEEISALLVALDQVDFGAACPHGRPVYHRLARGDLERFFRRG